MYPTSVAAWIRELEPRARTQPYPPLLRTCKRRQPDSRKRPRPRKKIRRVVQHEERFGDLSYALGGFSSRQERGKNIDGPIERWKPDIDLVRATIQFAIDTGRLQTVSKDTASIEDGNNERQ